MIKFIESIYLAEYIYLRYIINKNNNNNNKNNNESLGWSREVERVLFSWSERAVFSLGMTAGESASVVPLGSGVRERSDCEGAGRGL